MRMCHFRAQNGPFVMNKIFLVQTIIITFIYLLALFTVQNLKKFLQQIQIYENMPFLGPKCSISFPLKNIYFGTNNYQHFHLPIGSFLCAKFKKILTADPEFITMHNFWAQYGPFPLMRIFSENLLMSLVSFIHVYIHAKSQSQILIYQ